MPASLLASMMPWRQVLRSCADAPPESAAVATSIAENRTTFERLQRVMLAFLRFALPRIADWAFNHPALPGTIAVFGARASRPLPASSAILNFQSYSASFRVALLREPGIH